MVIDGYSIGGYWCLLIDIILVAIGGYCIDDYSVVSQRWLLMAIVL